jgi:hypothetical protein
MLQVIAAGSTAYEIPWPSQFKTFLSVMQLFLADVISLTRANCTTPMTFYASMTVVLLGFKILLGLVIFTPWALVACRRRTGGATSLASLIRAKWNTKVLGRRPSAALPAPGTSGRRLRRVGTDTIIVGMASPMSSRVHSFLSVDWAKLFKSVFLLLFVAYAAVSIKVLRVFRCRKIEGVWYLVADMRQECFTAEWWGYAAYGAVMGVLFVLGMPLLVLTILVRNRSQLYGPKSEQFRVKYGFLYEVYGPTAWFWEVEELLRRLILTAIVVLFDGSSPLQVTIAVMVCGWAHVLHSLYRPWCAGLHAGPPFTYYLQHASLGITSFVFLMGLLFKVGRQRVATLPTTLPTTPPLSRLCQPCFGALPCRCCGVSVVVIVPVVVTACVGVDPLPAVPVPCVRGCADGGRHPHVAHVPLPVWTPAVLVQPVPGVLFGPVCFPADPQHSLGQGRADAGNPTVGYASPTPGAVVAHGHWLDGAFAAGRAFCGPGQRRVDRCGRQGVFR